MCLINIRRSKPPWHFLLMLSLSFISVIFPSYINRLCRCSELIITNIHFGENGFALSQFHINQISWRMCHRNITQNLLVWSTFKLRWISAQFAKKHIDIFHILITSRLHNATSCTLPVVFVCGFDLYPIILISDNIWEFLTGHQYDIFGVEGRTLTRLPYYITRYFFKSFSRQFFIFQRIIGSAFVQSLFCFLH